MMIDAYTDLCGSKSKKNHAAPCGDGYSHGIHAGSEVKKNIFFRCCASVPWKCQSPRAWCAWAEDANVRCDGDGPGEMGIGNDGV